MFARPPIVTVPNIQSDLNPKPEVEPPTRSICLFSAATGSRSGVLAGLRFWPDGANVESTQGACFAAAHVYCKFRHIGLSGGWQSRRT